MTFEKGKRPDLVPKVPPADGEESGIEEHESFTPKPVIGIANQIKPIKKPKEIKKRIDFDLLAIPVSEEPPDKDRSKRGKLTVNTGWSPTPNSRAFKIEASTNPNHQKLKVLAMKWQIRWINPNRKIHKRVIPVNDNPLLSLQTIMGIFEGEIKKGTTLFNYKWWDNNMLQNCVDDWYKNGHIIEYRQIELYRFK